MLVMYTLCKILYTNLNKILNKTSRVTGLEWMGEGAIGVAPHHMAQPDWPRTYILLSLPTAGTKGVHHHAQCQMFWKETTANKSYFHHW